MHRAPSVFADLRKDKGAAGQINGLFGTYWQSRETSGEIAGSTEISKGLTWHRINSDGAYFAFETNHRRFMIASP